MKKNVCFISMILIMSIIMNGCGIIKRVFHRSIDTIKEETITFSYLPVEVKDFLYKSRKIPSWEMNGEDELFVCNTSYEYELKTIDAVKELWISHDLLIDKTNNITYRINYGIGMYPIIVCNREIFISTKSNLLSMIVNKSEDEMENMNWTFNRFLLDNDKRYQRVWKRNAKGSVKTQKAD